MIKYLKKTSVLYSLSSILKAGIQLIVGLAIAKYIAPEDYGIWGTLSLIIIYSSIVQLGVINGTNLELPTLMGKKNEKGVDELIGTGQTYLLLCSIAIFVIGMCYLYFYKNTLEPKLFWGIFSVTIIASITIYQDFLTATFRNPLSFQKLSLINIVQSVLNLLTTLLILYYAYYGLLVKTVFVILLYVLMLYLNRPVKVNLKFNKKVWFSLIKIGLPIFSLAYLQTTALSFDRLILIKFSNLNAVGIYSFAYLAFTSITLVSSSIASYIYPTMTFMFAEKNDKEELWKFLKKNISIIMLGLFIIGSFGAALIPFVIGNYFPNYKASIYIMQILFYAGVFNGSVIGVNVLLSMKKWKLIAIYHLVFTILMALCPLGFIYLSHMEIIVAVSFGVLVANFLNLLSGYSLVYYSLRISK